GCPIACSASSAGGARGRCWRSSTRAGDPRWYTRPLQRRSGAMKILFVGAGAIGSYLGAFLTRAGQDVTLIDPWAEQVETVRAKGISVSGPHDPFEARPAIHHLHEAQRLPRDFDVAFVPMHVYDTALATQLAAP